MKAHISFFHNREDVRQISYTLLCDEITEILDTVELIYLFFETGTSPSVVNAIRDAFMAFLDRNVHTQRIKIGTGLMTYQEWVSRLKKHNIPVKSYIEVLD